MPESFVQQLIAGVRLFAPRHALAQPVQQYVDGGGGEQGHELAGEQAADDGHAQGLAQLGPLAKANGQRQCAQAGGQRGHEDGAQALEAGFAHGAARVQAPLAFGAQGKVDDEDGVFLDDANEQEHANEGHDGEFHLHGQKRQHGSEARAGQGGEHGQRVNQALVQDAQHEVDDDDGGNDEPHLLALLLLHLRGVARELAAHAVGHADGVFGFAHGFLRGLQADAVGQVEREGG